ncbi:MAG: hypothetical protein K6E29_02615 [Cyanobacteria bacterium RUI128]|nr:hypothetical protein [Cyanobacteria bacterium RUI128]
MARKLVFMRTHIVEWYVIVEFDKLRRSMNRGDECILFVDNTKNVIPPDDNSPMKMVNFNGVDVKCFLFNEDVHIKSHLPYYTDNPDNNDYKKVLYFNGDYPFYYIKNYFPNYDYYWCTEYDVFCNGPSYKPFFKQWEKNKSDLIIADYRPSDIDPNVFYDSEWIYKKEEHYMSFFPVVRLSARAVNHLYTTRLQQGQLFEEIKNPPHTRWIYCETYVPTEITKAGMTVSLLDTENLRYTPDYNLNKERVFEFPNNKLYHPVR